MAQYKRYRGVKIGTRSSVGPYSILGVPPRGARDGQFPTRIGSGATIRSHSVIYAGNDIGRNFQTGHGAMVRESNIIGDDVSIGTGSIVEHHVKIGNSVRIHSQAFVPEYTTLEDGCWIGPRVVITNAKYPLSPGAKMSLKGATVCRNAKIGANSTLLPGVKIGEGALVGAGSVVTRDVPPGTVVVGNPARVVKSIKELPYD